MLSKRVLSKCLSFSNVDFNFVPKIRSSSIASALRNVQINEEKNKNEEWNNALPFYEIPGPPVLPIFGTKYTSLPIPVIGGFHFNQLDSFLSWIFKEFGPIVRFEKFYGEENIVLVHDANDIEWIYRNEGIAPDRISHSALEYYKNVTKKDIFGNIGGVVAVVPEKWLKFRSKISNDMLQPKIVKSHLSKIENVTKKFIDRIDLIADAQNEVPKDFKNEIAKWALESLCTFSSDIEMGCLDPVPNPEVQELIDAICHYDTALIEMDLSLPIWKHVYTPTWIKFEKAVDTILNTVIKHINIVVNRDIKTKNPENLSILERLLLKNVDNTKVALIAAFEMFIAGIETMKSSGSSMFYLLSKNPEVQEKLYQEIKRVTPSYDAALTNSDIENMPYLKAFIKEVLRIAPPIPLNTRRLVNDSVIRGYQVPKGTQIGFNILMAQTSEKYFMNPLKFEPERWLRTNANENAEKRHPFSNIPFSFGKRACVGRRLANLQLHTLTCKVLQKYKVEYKYKDLDYHSSPFFTLNGPLKFKFTKRS